MGLLGNLGTALLTVPLLVSSVLARTLERGKKRRRAARLRGAPGRRPRETATAAEHAAPPSRTASATEIDGMRRELGAVLDAHPGSRDVFRYLAHFERRFAKHGPPVLEAMPVERLRRALAQFEAIVINWSEPHLADLRSRMAVALSKRGSAGLWAPAATVSKTYAPRRMPMIVSEGASAEGGPNDFQSSRQVEVEDDIGISRFEAAMGEWRVAERQVHTAAAFGGQPVAG